jgi:hypothetical protein
VGQISPKHYLLLKLKINLFKLKKEADNHQQEARPSKEKSREQSEGAT